MTSTATKPSKATVPAQANGKADTTAGVPLFLGPVRDHTTEAGQYTVHVETIREYLTRVGVYDPTTDTFDLNKIPKSDVQRGLIAIGAKNEKDAMLYDVMRGCGLPSFVLYQDGEDGAEDLYIEILDALQRTHVVTVCAIGLQGISKEGAEYIGAAEFMRNMDSKDHPGRVQVPRMSFTDFMNHKVTFQLYTGLTDEEKSYKFMKLNVGQQKVSAAHLAEISLKGERELFTTWGLPTITEKEKKEAPKTTRKTTTNGDGTPPPVKKYPLDMMLLNLCGYVTIQNNPDKKDPFSPGMSDKIREVVSKIGEDVVGSDFRWLYEELFPALRANYENEFPGLKKDSDMFGTPILAALAYARSQDITVEEIQDRKDELIERLQDGNTADPLTMISGRFSWKNLVNDDAMKGSDGVRSRKLTYQGFKLYFLKGKQKMGLPVSWQDAKTEATN